MQKNITFSEFITRLIIILLVILLIMIYLSERKNTTLEPILLVFQTDYQDKNDRIMRTKNTLNDHETLFVNQDIQNFGRLGNYLMITTGKENKESTINLFNLTTKRTKVISSNGKYISNILPSLGKFVFLVEDLVNSSRTYEGKIAVMEEGQENFTLVNQDFIGNPVKNFFVYPSSNLLIFNGFGDKYYFKDLTNPAKVTTLEIETTKIIGFINPKQIVYYDNRSLATQNFEILDLITNQKILIETGISYTADIVVSANTKSVFFLQPLDKRNDDTRGIRNLANNKIYNLTGQSVNGLDMSLDNRYILFDKYPNNTNITPSKRSFSIFDIEKETFLRNAVEGSFVIWGS